MGGTTGNAVPNFGGSITAYEGYGEVSVPLLKDAPGAYLLSLDASARVAHYDIDNVGTVFSWRGGIQYAPITDIRFRAQYARAQRAQIGRAHVCTPVPNAQLVCRLLLEKKNTESQRTE